MSNAKEFKSVKLSGKVNYGTWKYAFHKYVSLTVEGFKLSRDLKNGRPVYHLYYKGGKYAELPAYIEAKNKWNSMFPYNETVESKANGKFIWEYNEVEAEVVDNVSSVAAAPKKVTNAMILEALMGIKNEVASLNERVTALENK